jgi:hypothetical protein
MPQQLVRQLTPVMLESKVEVDVIPKQHTCHVPASRPESRASPPIDPSYRSLRTRHTRPVTSDTISNQT